MRHLLALPLLAVGALLPLACGDDDEGDGGASGDLEQACEDFCHAAFSIDCGDQQITVAQCRAQCSYLDDQLLGVCVSEYTATLRCAADGGFECVNGAPVPRSACTSEATALTECDETAPCQRLCSAAAEAGCGGADCVDACLAEKEQLNAGGGSCGYNYGGLADCGARTGVVCVGGEPSAPECADEALSVGECLAEGGDVCAGWCWAAAELGCADGCAEACAARLADPNCGDEYATMLDCGMFFGDVVCAGGTLTPSDICESDVATWQACGGQ